MNWRLCTLSVLLCCRLETDKQVKGDTVPGIVCSAVLVTYDLRRALRQRRMHPHINTNTY